MAEPSFADRYAEAGIAPTATAIQQRQASTDRIVASITPAQILDLIGYYYGLQLPDPIWFRDELNKEDPTFSLINARREAKLLCAIMLGRLVANGGSLATLGVIVAGAGGRRVPEEAAWVVQKAQDKLASLAVSERVVKRLEPKVGSTFTKNLEQEVTVLPTNDWPKLIELLGKMRAESQSSMATMAKQTNTLMDELKRRADYQREESQILWWVFNGLSQALDRTFDTLDPPQAAVVAAIDLGCLTTKSTVGPIASTAILERVLSGAKKAHAKTEVTLAGAIDGLQSEDLAKLEIRPQKAPASITPFTAALDLARNLGAGAWHAKFADATGLSASAAIEPLDLAQQLYKEHLLGQLL